MTERLIYRSGDLLVVADDLVAELFVNLSSMRVPCARLGVRVRPAKHDQINVQFGFVVAPDQPMVGADVRLLPGSTGFSLAGAEAPRLASFFAEVAGAAGRS
jgi:hypothetical protein